MARGSRHLPVALAFVLKHLLAWAKEVLYLFRSEHMLPCLPVVHTREHRRQDSMLRLGRTRDKIESHSTFPNATSKFYPTRSFHKARTGTPRAREAWKTSWESSTPTIAPSSKCGGAELHLEHLIWFNPNNNGS